MTQRRKKKPLVERTKREGIPLRLYIPEDLPMHHADSANIVHIQGNFYLSFLQIQMPLIIDDSEFEKLKEIPSKCVSRVILNEETLEKMIEVLTKHLNRVREKRAKAESTDGDTEEASKTDILPDTESDTSD